MVYSARCGGSGPELGTPCLYVSSFYSGFHVLTFLKGVDTKNKRILNMGKLKAIVYLANPDEWSSISKTISYFYQNPTALISYFVR
jgi:hypothetical protein